VGETVQFFITLMDSMKLNMVAVDQVIPLLNHSSAFRSIIQKDVLTSRQGARAGEEPDSAVVQFMHSLMVPLCLKSSGSSISCIFDRLRPRVRREQQRWIT